MGIPCMMEVPCLGRSVDLAFIMDGMIYSVEFKLRNWRKALQQARDHQLGADYSFICMCEYPTTVKMKVAAIALGIGVFSFLNNDGYPFSVTVTGAVSSVQWRIAREKLACLISGALEREDENADT